MTYYYRLTARSHDGREGFDCTLGFECADEENARVGATAKGRAMCYLANFDGATSSLRVERVAEPEPTP